MTLSAEFRVQECYGPLQQLLTSVYATYFSYSSILDIN